jgi:nitrogen regulatory protein P-II 1
MKKIEVIFNPFKLEDVKEALVAADIVGMTISDVKGYGRQKGYSEMYRGTEHIVEFVPKTKMEIIVKEEKVNTIIEIIQESAKTGKIGDGKIFVSPIEDIIRIRTGERGEEAV